MSVEFKLTLAVDVASETKSPIEADKSSFGNNKEEDSSCA